MEKPNRESLRLKHSVWFSFSTAVLTDKRKIQWLSFYSSLCVMFAQGNGRLGGFDISYASSKEILGKTEGKRENGFQRDLEAYFKPLFIHLVIK